MSTQAQPTNNVQVVSLAQIVVNEDFNARKKYDPELVKNLATDIRKNTQLNPLVVRPIPGKPGMFELISGFTRVRAIRQNAEDDKNPNPTALVNVVDGAEEAGAHLMNLGENMLRRNLTPYEIALKCKFISDKFGLSGSQIGSQVRRGAAYINNLLRILDRVHPDILAEWAAEHDRATTDFLAKLASEDDKAKQLERWQIACGLVTSPAAGATDGVTDDGDGDGASGENPPRELKRASVVKLTEAFEAIKTSKKAAEWKEGALVALKFALGVTATIPGVYNPEKPKADKPKADKPKADKPKADKPKK